MSKRTVVKSSPSKSAGKSSARKPAVAKSRTPKSSLQASAKPGQKRIVALGKSSSKVIAMLPGRVVAKSKPARTVAAKVSPSVASKSAKSNGSSIASLKVPAVAASAPVNGKPVAAKATSGRRSKTAAVKPSLGARTEPIRISVSPDWKSPPKKVEESPKNGNSRFAQNAPLPLPSVPTDGKPKRNVAGIHARDLEHYRNLLLDKRRELVGDMSAMEREALRSANGTNLSNLPLHMADQGTDNYEQEFTLGLVEKDRVLLREINRGLAKIQDGTYGICEGTGKPINPARLEAQPWAKYSIEYARLLERGLVRR